MAKHAINLLRKYDLRKTPVRLATLQLFLEASHALAHSDIESHFEHEIDRVTIYRTLTTFEEKGLIHKAYDGGEAIKYAICKDHCEAHDHNDDHLHFNCLNCGKTYCLEGYPVPDIDIPNGFQVSELYLFAKGTCEECIAENAGS